jgi:hypothetical protein
MWTHILTIVSFLQLSAHASDLELLQPVNEVSLNCAPSTFRLLNNEIFDNEIHVSEILNRESRNCTLKVVESSKFEVAVTSDNVDMDVLKSRHYEVKVEIVGNKKYPEYFPRHLAKTLTGTTDFTYTNTPLKVIRRNDLIDFGSTLATLSLINNKIDDISYDAFYSLTNLTRLYINGNKLKMLPSNLFINTPVFETLYVFSNELTELHPDLFKDCPQFTFLDADQNNIENIHEDLFKNNPNMTFISMSHNKVKNIAINFTKFKFLKYVDFEGNGEACNLKYYPDESPEESERRTIFGTITEFQEKIEETCRE